MSKSFLLQLAFTLIASSVIAIFLSCAESKAVNSVAMRTKIQPKSIWTTEWSHDGKYIGVAGDDSTLWIYNGNDYSLYKTYHLNTEIKNISWHPQENLLAIATSKGAQLLNMAKGHLEEIGDIKFGGRGIDWNYNGELLALADGRGMLQIMNKQGKLIRSIAKHNFKTYMTLDWHPSKNIIVTGSDEIILFDTSGKRLALINHRPEHTSVLAARWHPSGAFFATGDYGHEDEGQPTLLQFWREDGTLIKQMLGHHAEIRNLNWNADGTKLATASDGLRIWSDHGQLLNESPTGDRLWGITWSKDQGRIATGTYGNGKVRIWTADGKLIKDIY